LFDRPTFNTLKGVDSGQGESDRRAGSGTEPRGGSLVDELTARVVALVRGGRRRAAAGTSTTRLETFERRARAVADDAPKGESARRVATVQFIGDAVAALALDGALTGQEIRKTLAEAAALLDIPAEALRLLVYRQALASREAAQFSPRLAADFFLQMLIHLDVVQAASLWTPGDRGRLECVVEAGDAPRSRRLGLAARAALEDGSSATGSVCALPVRRWDHPFAALAIRSARSCRDVRPYLEEAAEAISALLERETLFERNSERERDLVAAAERRIVRVALDLHDGPLQELVALAGDLRLARAQVASMLEGHEQRIVEGRFDDLEARLRELDRALRGIVQSARSTSVVERPLEDALRNEVDGIERAAEVAAELAVEGDLDGLTDSQKIVLFRVAQEALSNVRKHSGATEVSVRLFGAPAYVSLTISDNGCGFELSQAFDQSDRFGLSGLRERVRLLGGDITILSRPGAGVTIQATLPRWKPIRTLDGPTFVVPA
jgi:signal transduction histidine kinase